MTIPGQAQRGREAGREGGRQGGREAGREGGREGVKIHEWLALHSHIGA